MIVIIIIAQAMVVFSLKAIATLTYFFMLKAILAFILILLKLLFLPMSI